MENSTHVYFYFFILFLTAFLFAAGAIKFTVFLSRTLFGSGEKNTENDAYAGGFYILSPVTVRFPVRFAFIALLLVLFNAELLLLLPWALSLRLSQEEGVLVALLVIAFWGIGYFYGYKKGALEWK